MDQNDATRRLSRPDASAAVTGLGWRYILGTFRTAVPVDSMAGAVDVAARAVAACGGDADGHLSVDLRGDRVVLTLVTAASGWASALDADLARRISAELAGAGFGTDPDVGGAAPRSVQVMEIAIDALDIGAVRPFWKAVLGYVAEAGADGPTDPLIDPYGQCPPVWFQRMDRPRPQRNRIHFDVSVPHDEAGHRVRAALAAGGRLVSADRAPAFWVLADAEGNEACVTTWQGRD